MEIIIQLISVGVSIVFLVMLMDRLDKMIVLFNAMHRESRRLHGLDADEPL